MHVFRVIQARIMFSERQVLDCARKVKWQGACCESIATLVAETAHQAATVADFTIVNSGNREAGGKGRFVADTSKRAGAL